MSALVKYRNRVEYSFYCWLGAFPESWHANDEIRFLEFAKTVCSNSAKKWMSVEYLEARILQEKPNFNSDRLDDLLIGYRYLISFPKAKTLHRGFHIQNGSNASSSNYIEKGIKNGKFYEKELPRKFL